RKAGTKRQSQPRTCVASASLRVGALRTSFAAFNKRVMGRRLDYFGQAERYAENPAGTLGRALVPQLRETRRFREACGVAATVPPADPVHGIYGAGLWQHVPRNLADRKEI